MILSAVVLPQPDGPSSERNSPLRTARSTPSTAVMAPKRLTTPTSSASISTPAASLVIALPAAAQAALN